MNWFLRMWFTLRYSAYWCWQNVQLTRVMWRFSALKPPCVTFFGGGKLRLTDRYAQDARHLAHMCVDQGFSIITGGGSGIMEAAAQGALDAGQRRLSSIGVLLTGIADGYTPSENSFLVRVDNLVVRKWLMTHFSSACVVFPGGVGTQNEFAELLTLFDMRMLNRVPLVLYGREYWQPLIEWILQDGVKRGFVAPEIAHTFVLADNVKEAFDCLVSSVKSSEKS